MALFAEKDEIVVSARMVPAASQCPAREGEAALDLNSGTTSLAVRRAGRLDPGSAVEAAGRPWPGRLVRRDRRPARDRCRLGPDDYLGLADLLAGRYPLTMIDPRPSA